MTQALVPTLGFVLERDDLCERLGGGIPRGSLVVLEGPFGAGKSILTQRILYGLLEAGAGVTYVSTELTTAGFLAQMASLDYDVGPAMMEERLVFLPVHPMVGARAPPHELLERIAKARLMYTKDVIAFDTFSKFLADHLRAAGTGHGAREQVEAVLHLFKRLTALGKTVLLTFEEDHVPDEVISSFKEAADVMWQLQFELIGATASRRIVVKRMSRAPGRFAEVIGFRVEPGLGIVIEIKSVV